MSGALPPALAAAGVDARILLPAYTAVLAHAKDARALAELEVLGHPVRLLEWRLGESVPILLADSPALYARSGGPYQADDGDDWEDNAMRFGVLSKLAAILGSEASPLDWRPDVVHCNDWPTALVPMYLRQMRKRHAASVVTIHNLAFQGVFPYDEIEGLEVPEKTRGMEGLEFHGRASFLKAGIILADAVTTVSPTYAREIQTKELGFGLEGVLRMRSAVLHGVLNGIDTALWNPQTDPFLATTYGVLTLERKAANKRLLRKRFHLEGPDDLPLLGCVSRITHQKGMDVLAQAIPELVALRAQVAIVGTGDREMVGKLKAMEARHRGNVSVFIGFDESLAHLIEGGCDMFLMPSRFEPCGMNQMYSQRYGTPPVANATGGLVDTIVDEGGTSSPEATGFLIPEPTPTALVVGVNRAIAAYRDPSRWKRLQVKGMTRDFGWERAARDYIRIYESVRSTS